MKIGEVCLETNNVIALADFYRKILNIEGDCKDEVHQFILTEETILTIYNDGTVKNNQNQNISLAFTVDDVDKEYEKLLSLGVKIIQPPQVQPWGAKNMLFCDPDGNHIYFRSIPENNGVSSKPNEQ
ncbi:VOC family protein [Lachnospiraceae bacterium MD1]|uniref:VOC family protein n=1 Tax=Variimorphobacter saccharofermentans TaxID=2755051 RepID=A0A839K188_9FIRM|nr:VOC family protein [Variimorphobacter saccharofermentans]MBB2183665.1 VOC family protein [Variimorphobacter saccharofermentans]